MLHCSAVYTCAYVFAIVCAEIMWYLTYAIEYHGISNNFMSVHNMYTREIIGYTIMAAFIACMCMRIFISILATFEYDMH